MENSFRYSFNEKRYHTFNYYLKNKYAKNQKYPNISKSTVYRNLDVLSQEGLLNRIVHKEGNRFDLTLNNHYHVYCKICHKLVDTGIPYNEDFDKKVAAETCFLIDKHSIVFEGICPECQEKMKGKTK